MADPIDLRIGEKLKLARIAQRLTQSDLAQELGMSFQQIQKYEAGINRISASRLYEMSKVLDVPVQTFFEGIEGEDVAPVRPSLKT